MTEEPNTHIMYSFLVFG